MGHVIRALSKKALGQAAEDDSSVIRVIAPHRKGD